MKNSMSTLFLIFAIIYLISPLDAVPGPIDDAILLLLAMKCKNENDD